MEHKTTNKAKLLSLLLIFVIASTGACKKDRGEQIDKLPKTFDSKQEAKVYINRKLNEYGKILAKYAINPEMRKLVNSKVAEKFDGDYNVLLKDLLKNSPSEKLFLKSNLKMTIAPTPAAPAIEPLNLQLLEVALIEPLIVNGETMYPQIYIPFFEEQELEPIEPGDPGTPIEPDPCLHVVSNSLEPVYPNPVIVAYDGEESTGQETFTGYTYDQNGLLIENIPVDECFAKRHRVWAVTLNERPPLPPNIVAELPTSYSGQSNIAQAAFIKNMKIKVNKESWLKGANDLEMTWSMSWKDGVNPITNTYAVHPFELSTFRGGAGFTYIYTIGLGKYTKRDVKKGRNKELNIDYAVFGKPTSFVYGGGEWNSMRDWYDKMGTHIYYVIYEHDTWADKDAYIPVESPKAGFPNTVKVIALSNNSPYISGRIKIVPFGAIAIGSSTYLTIQENDQIYFHATNKP